MVDVAYAPAHAPASAPSPSTMPAESGRLQQLDYRMVSTWARQSRWTEWERDDAAEAFALAARLAAVEGTRLLQRVLQRRAARGDPPRGFCEEDRDLTMAAACAGVELVGRPLVPPAVFNLIRFPRLYGEFAEAAFSTPPGQSLCAVDASELTARCEAAEAEFDGSGGPPPRAKRALCCEGVEPAQAGKRARPLL